MNDELKDMLNDLSTAQQALTWLTVLWRWLFRSPHRSWNINEVYPVVHLLG